MRTLFTGFLRFCRDASRLRFVMKTQVTPLQNYRSFLREVLIERQKKNPQLSLRSFAKSLGLQSSFLSMVLSGKRDISEETAARISEKLDFTAQDSKKFNLLLRIEKAGSAKQKESLMSELQELEPTTLGKIDLAVEQFKMIAEWFHLPLKILIDLDGFDWSEENAAKALGITVHQVRDGLTRMANLELIEFTQGQKPTLIENRVSIASPFKNEALRKYHGQMLGKAIEALETQTPDTRYTGTNNLALDSEQLKAVHRVMEDAQDKVAAIAAKRSKTKRLYHASFNLFELTQHSTSKPKRK